MRLSTCSHHLKGSITLTAAALTLALPMILSGCDREVSHESQTKVRSDGSTKTQEKVVKRAPDGSIITEETKQTTPPTNP